MKSLSSILELSSIVLVFCDVIFAAAVPDDSLMVHRKAIPPKYDFPNLARSPSHGIEPVKPRTGSQLSKRQACNFGYSLCPYNTCCESQNICCGYWCCTSGYGCVTDPYGAPACCLTTAISSGTCFTSSGPTCGSGQYSCPQGTGCCAIGDTCYIDPTYGPMCQSGSAVPTPSFIDPPIPTPNDVGGGGGGGGDGGGYDGGDDSGYEEPEDNEDDEFQDNETERYKPPPRSNKGPVIGGSVGAFIVIALLAIGTGIWVKRRADAKNAAASVANVPVKSESSI